MVSAKKSLSHTDDGAKYAARCQKDRHEGTGK
jgi:hypothetical protein